jgi:hypothetical protein
VAEPLKPAELQPSTVNPPAAAPFETPPPPGLAHRTVNTHQRHLGTHVRARHQGATHHPHSHTLTTHHAVHHPHVGASTRHRSAAGRHPGIAQHTTRLHKTSAHLAARAGLQRLELGTITSYNGVTNAAYVRLSGSQANVVGPLPLGLGLAGVPNLVGTRCLVSMLDESNPNDSVIVALFNGQFAPFAQSGRAALTLTSWQFAGTVNFATAFANQLFAVTATSDDANYVASVSGATTNSFVLTVTRREGQTQTQNGQVSCTILNGNTTGSATVSFPVAFAVGRNVVVCSQDSRFWATVSAIGNTGCTVTLTSPTAVVGNQNANVDWVAFGDPSVSLVVNVDWTAIGR